MFDSKLKGKVFDQEYGYLIIPAKQFSMKLKLSDVRVSIFEETLTDILIQTYDTSSGHKVLINPKPLVEYSFLFMFRNADSGSGGILQHIVNRKYNNRYYRTDKRLTSDFATTNNYIQHSMPLNRSSRPKLIYYGARNEG